MGRSSKYTRKYLKYKHKYNKLLQELGLDETEEEAAELSGDVELSNEYDNTMILTTNTYEELPDVKPDDEILVDDMDARFENTNKMPYLIGQFKKEEAIIYDIDNFDRSVFISINKKPVDNNKVLYIKTVDDFDALTLSYGIMRKKKLYIDWDKINARYKGICIRLTATNERDLDIPYNGKTVESWLNYDFGNDLLDKVILFERRPGNKIYAPLEIIITSPFKGKVVDSFAVDETLFARIKDTVRHDRILFIDTLKDFDKFTNRYGFIGKKDGIEFININWAKVKEHYIGFYINKDTGLKEDRYLVAFFDSKRYSSWVSKLNLEIGFVYLFD